MKKTLLIILAITLLGCTQTVKTPSNLTNKSFPQIKGQNLSKEEIIIPDHFSGKATVLLVGYQQKAQFDIDRWILGLLQAEVPVQIAEVPTIAGMMPEMVQGFINNGMRSGIPQNDWASVITVYEDASKIVDALGNEKPQNAHVVLIDPRGQIVWSAHEGYSAQQILELKNITQTLR